MAALIVFGVARCEKDGPYKAEDGSGKFPGDNKNGRNWPSL